MESSQKILNLNPHIEDISMAKTFGSNEYEVKWLVIYNLLQLMLFSIKQTF